jgi:hypothetical protein
MKLENKLTAACFVLAVILLFAFQHPNILFSQGHQGWVSAHGLAIIKHATWDNFLLGFTCLFKDQNNNMGFYYFDRYPVFFSAIMNGLISFFKQDVVKEVAFARTLMNIIYLATMFLGYLTANLILKNKLKSFTAALLTFSTTYFMYYRDMVHFDQPAILGFMAMMFVITRYSVSGNEKGLLLTAAIAPLLGRGYSTNFLQLLWFGLSLVQLIRSGNFKLNMHFLKTFKPLHCLLIGGTLSASFLAYNVVMEAQIREISIKQTSIVRSAIHRLGGNKKFNKEKSAQTAWPTFTKSQIKRFSAGLIPYSIYNVLDKGFAEKPSVYALLFLAALLGIFAYSFFYKKGFRDLSDHPYLYILALLSGAFWLFPMRNLAAFHNYTNCYYVITYLFIFMFALRRLSQAQSLVILCLAFVCYGTSLSGVYQTHERKNKTAQLNHQDFSTIRNTLKPGETVFVVNGYRNLIDGCPYASCYYLAHNPIATSLKNADFILSQKDESLSGSVTPNNKKVFLYKNVEKL